MWHSFLFKRYEMIRIESRGFLDEKMAEDIFAIMKELAGRVSMFSKLVIFTETEDGTFKVKRLVIQCEDNQGHWLAEYLRLVYKEFTQHINELDDATRAACARFILKPFRTKPFPDYPNLIALY